jgi:hypothetical protein
LSDYNEIAIVCQVIQFGEFERVGGAEGIHTDTLRSKMKKLKIPERYGKIEPGT